MDTMRRKDKMNRVVKKMRAGENNNKGVDKKWKE